MVLVSSELPELIGMSDRILMLHEGRIAGEFERGATQEQLLAAAMGGEIEDATPAPPSQPAVQAMPRMRREPYIVSPQFFLPIL